MEIEAKFSVPDLASFVRLRSADTIGSFALGAGEVVEVLDTYMDTAGRKILAGGYACRFRQELGGLRVTLKGLSSAGGAVHRREELEVILQAEQPTDEWAAGPARDLALELTGGDPLVRLFELHQTRIVRPVSKDDLIVAECSLDEVRFAIRDREQVYYEAEFELTPEGSEDDLAAMVTTLQQEWALLPEPRSKFERALQVLDAPRDGILLTPQEREVCARIEGREDRLGLQARILLASDEGVAPREADRLIGTAARTTRRWRAAFRRQRLGMFPPDVVNTATEPSPPGQGEILPETPVGAQESLGGVPVPQVILLKEPGIGPDDTVAEAACKTLLFHFQRMLYHEPGTRLGEDIEELHDMRVATRRMRAALRVFGAYLDERQLAPFTRRLQRAGGVLGTLRDLDVFWEKTQHYLDALPSERQTELAPLRAAWEAERERARTDMLAFLNSRRFREFKDGFGDFLRKPNAGARPPLTGAGEPRPRFLRHAAPVILYQALATVRAYDEWVIERDDVPLTRLHQLRIASKRLRYTLEFLEEVLGPEAKRLIDDIKALQDHLGNLQDAIVASNLLRDFLTWGTWGHAAGKSPMSLPAEPVVAPGVAAYLAVRQAELQRLLDTFPPVWERVRRPAFSAQISAALSTL